MWSLNLFPVFKNLIHKIVWNEMELNSYRSSCHRFIPRCLTLVNGLHEIFPVNKLSNWIRLSTTHCLVVINLLRRAGGRMRACMAWVWPGCCFCISLDVLFHRRRTSAEFVDTVKLQPAVMRELQHHLSAFFSLSLFWSPEFHPSGVRAYFI